ncbi:phosphatidate cytidylyltransferase [sulfur-oxidizing endosymbiont of Gigantopelta aegis]|uniref:phosphatidate cytidylyltransferase n=1 Tax=sulfur-oxidizing endosymbiont of Gigantopelta aegis TaxID=2794934 RepID=UPI0018DDFA78|nr:phosphatidate cytidylyltransferase [sulfur-oxidizing endosymbiont of Gigantopelta aegis]
MLKLRVITALILFPLAVSGILFLPKHYFAALFGLVMLLGAYEWAGFAKFPSVLAKLAYVLMVAVILLSIWLLNFILPMNFMNGLAAVFWLFAFVLLVAYPKSASFWSGKIIIISIMGFFLLSIAWYAVVKIHEIEALQFAQTQISGPYLLLSSMMLIWAADTGAYFSGKRFGKNKLAPKVSPGKSIEGVMGGLLLAVLIVILFTAWHGGQLQDYFNVIGITLVTVIFSVIGDLMESMFKRQADIKDSGNILPGHGGILDRIDSITAACPVFLIALSLVYL